MDYVTGLLISMDWKGTSYDSILAVVDGLMKMIHYKPMQITMDALGFAEVFIDLIVRHGSPRPPRLDRTSRLNRYLKVLVFFVLLPGWQANYDLVLVVDLLKKMLRDEPLQIPIDVPRLPRLNYQ